MAQVPASKGTENKQQNFDRVLSTERFTGFRAILDKVAPSREALCEAVREASSYEDLLGKLGFRITLTKQIHVQDSYSRVGPAGGIKSVLPYYDIPTHSSLPTLIHYDSTVTTTQRAADFFNETLAELKRQLSVE